MFEFVIGSSLATAAGLNAWMPLFLLGLADRFLPSMTLPSGWSWLSSDVALWVFGILLVLEVIADKIPALDTINDLVQSVLRPTAGGIAFGAGSSAQTVAVDDPDFFASNAWIPILIGIVIALAVHMLKAATRVASNAATAGIAAPMLSAAEDGASLALSVASLLFPLLAGLLLLSLLTAVYLLIRKLRQRRRDAQPATIR